MRPLRILACALLLIVAPALAAPLAVNDEISPDPPQFVDRCLSSLQLEPVEADMASPSATRIAFLPLLLAAVIAAVYGSPLYARCYRYLFGPLDNY
ncbi:MAG TPA: hypothetical protein VKV17_05835 [Bryobacteraceae bacterium]|nr:hypothetical protein [Bryobacteraceae bacterium]